MIKTVVDRVDKFDLFLVHQVLSLPGKKTFDNLFYWASRSGDGPWYVLCVLALLPVDPGYGIQIAIAGCLGFFIELPLYHYIKTRVKRKRPCDQIGVESLIVPPDYFSFPSGHTAAAFLMATLIGHFYPLFTIPALLWAATVGFSRVYLRVHYPSDILAGAILGVACSQTGLFLSTLLRAL